VAENAPPYIIHKHCALLFESRAKDVLIADTSLETPFHDLNSSQLQSQSRQRKTCHPFLTMDFFKTHNLTILAIPAYYVMAIMPHAYAISITKNHDPKIWDNSCPRGSNLKSKLQSSLTPEDFSKYERAEAAQTNALENLPLFASAVVVANLAGLKRAGLGGVEGFVGMWFVVRALHSLTYITNTDKKLSYVRSGLWFTGLALCVRVFGKASRVLNGSLA
jgi:uncharacterized MAPEG superfamily protein